jgi:hypothetical protein
MRQKNILLNGICTCFSIYASYTKDCGTEMLAAYEVSLRENQSFNATQLYYRECFSTHDEWQRGNKCFAIKYNLVL